MSFHHFKAGGWELLTSPINLGPAMKSRIAYGGFFMRRMNENQTGWIEQLTDRPRVRAIERNGAGK